MYTPLVSLSEKNFEVGDTVTRLESAERTAAMLRSILEAEEAHRQARMYTRVRALSSLVEIAVCGAARDVIDAERLLTPRTRILFRSRDENERQARIAALQAEGTACVYGVNEARGGAVVQLAKTSPGSTELRINDKLAMSLQVSADDDQKKGRANLVLVNEDKEPHPVTVIDREQAVELKTEVEDIITTTQWEAGRYAETALTLHLHTYHAANNYLPLDIQADKISWLKASKEYNQSNNLALDLQQIRAATAAE